MINFVAIEGLDGAGKTTFTKHLVKVLKEVATDALHVEYVHFPYYKSVTGEQILEFLHHGNINDHRERDKFIRLCMLNRREWFDANYERLSRYENVIVIADRYRHSNNFLNCSKFTDIPKAISKYKDIELNGYGIKKERLNYFLDVPLEMALQRLGDKKTADQYENADNMKKVYSKQQTVLRHITDSNFTILPANLLDKDYLAMAYPDLVEDIPDMHTAVFMYFAYLIAKDINNKILRHYDGKAKFHTGMLLKQPKVRLLVKEAIQQLNRVIG